VDAEPHGEGNAILGLQSAVQDANGIDNPQTRMHRTPASSSWAGSVERQSLQHLSSVSLFVMSHSFR
jgi:hypothetical protein